MATGLDQIVNVQITRETSAPSQVGFGVPLLVGTSDRYAAGVRVMAFASLEEVEATFTAGDVEITMARNAFSQSPRPSLVKIGQLEAADAGDYVAALTAIQAVDNDFYGIVIESRAKADIEAVAQWTEAQIKVFIAVSGDQDILDQTAGNVLEVLNGAAYNRTLLLFSGDTDDHAGAALAGLQLPKVVGSTNWAYQTLAGITADNLTTTQCNYIQGLNGNVYVTVNDINHTQFGRVVGSEFIDVIRGADFIQARIQERIFFGKINLERIPYTVNGIGLIESWVRSILQQARDTNGILESFETSVPEIADINPTDIANRCLPDVTFVGVLAGAINQTKIQGRLVLSEDLI